MKVEISKGTAIGELVAPPSKSYAHRLLIAAFLSKKSAISNIAFSNDIKATMSCLESLGASFNISKDKVKVTRGRNKNEKMDANESGSTLRFMIPLALYINGEVNISGKEKLFSRGLDVYIDLFNKLGFEYRLDELSLYAKGRLLPGRYEIDASLSSQYISGLLFVLPLLKGDSELILLGEVESEPYIDITIDVLDMFGVKVEKSDRLIKIKGNQKYISKDVTNQGDYSNSSFFEMLNYLGGKVKISGLDSDSKQGDKLYLDYFPLLTKGHPSIDIKNTIDLGPILFAFASVFNGAKFINIRRLRIKESDRVMDTLKIIEKFNVTYELKENELEIFKSDLRKPNEAIDTYNDHRQVMMTAILLTLFGGTILKAEAVNKSFPDFFIKLRSLGIEVKEYDR